MWTIISSALYYEEHPVPLIQIFTIIFQSPRRVKG